MTHAVTKSELLNVAERMGDDDVLLCDMWDRENFCFGYQVELTPALWREFIDDYSRRCGLEDLRDSIDEFIDGLPDDVKRSVDPERYAC
jgi:hypothetical protein